MKKKIIKIPVSLIAAALVFCCLTVGYYTYENKNDVTVTEYTKKSEKIENDITVVQLSDLHGNEIGKDNSLIVEEVKKADPDLILMTGDMFSRSGDGYGETLTLIEKLYGTAPIYYSLGNHENDYFEKNEDDKLDMIGAIEKSGAVVLEHEYRDITVKGSDIRLGGFFGYALRPDPDYFEELRKKGYFRGWRFDMAWNGGADDAFLKACANTDIFTLLMCHVPDGFILFDSFGTYKADLILSGHLHGGQIVLPAVGPLIAPNQGLFPEKPCGEFFSGSSMIVVSKGLGSGKIIPRINNTPEICVINIIAE